MACSHQNQIPSIEAMAKFCECQIPGVIFKFLPKDEMGQLHLLHALEDAILLTRPHHQFEPFSHNQIGAKRCSEDAQYACIHNCTEYMICNARKCCPASFLALKIIA